MRCNRMRNECDDWIPAHTHFMALMRGLRGECVLYGLSLRSIADKIHSME